MEFNTKKCGVMEMGQGERQPRWTYRMGKEVINKGSVERDLGVVVQDNLSAEKHQ